ncbi:MAG: class I SAM-dependent methyltransferase [Pseudomonadota bacterium]
MFAAQLAARYDRVAPTWGSKIARLGYPAAYGDLVTAADIPWQLGPCLDFGCGSGALSEAMASSHDIARIDLLDVSDAMLAEAGRTLGRAGARVGNTYRDLAELNSATGRYDVILAGHVIEHFDNPAEILAALSRFLAPEGTLLLAVSRPHWCTALLRTLWQHRAYAPEAVLSWGDAAGLKGRAIPFVAGPPSRTSMGYVFLGKAR